MISRKLDSVKVSTRSGCRLDQETKKRQLVIDLLADREGSCRSTPDYVVVLNRGEAG